MTWKSAPSAYWSPRCPGCEKLTDFTGSLCIVPALMYDLKGYRLGYGGGYYDRFLSGYDGYKIGITYWAQYPAVPALWTV